jgi:hypothetical protein
MRPDSGTNNDIETGKNQIKNEANPIKSLLLFIKIQSLLKLLTLINLLL